jgi:hypothetical protein
MTTETKKKRADASLARAKATLTKAFHDYQNWLVEDCRWQGVDLDAGDTESFVDFAKETLTP